MFGCQVDRVLRFPALLGCVLAPVPALALPGGAGTFAGLVWEAPAAGPEDDFAAVDALFRTYEEVSGTRLAPSERGRAGLKVNTRHGAAMATPLPLLEAAIMALERRGFRREDILIVDGSANDLRAAGILPLTGSGPARFQGCRVIALDQGGHFDPDWFYDSPLPPVRRDEPVLGLGLSRSNSLEAGDEERRSYLPVPLIFEVDFWINLPVAVDSPALGIDGALANATLWNVSNSIRFLANPATASAAVAEIAAIPELRERMVLHLVSLRRYQYIGGPGARSLYSRSEPRLWLSTDPVALDRLLLTRLNDARRHEGFPEITPLPDQLRFAASLGLGTDIPSDIMIEPVDVPDTPAPPAIPPDEVVEP